MHIFEYGQTEVNHLKKSDKKLGKAIDEIGMIERPVIPDLFTALVRNIVGQQISSKAATTVWNRMKDFFEDITPETIVRAGADEIHRCGVSNRKASYIKDIGEAVTNGELDLTKLHELPDDEVIKRLCALKGIGQWTAEMLLIFSMQRPDVVSWGDLAIRRGMMTLYNLETLSKEQFEAYRKCYSPYGSVASLYLWVLSKE